MWGGEVLAVIAGVLALGAVLTAAAAPTNAKVPHRAGIVAFKAGEFEKALLLFQEAQRTGADQRVHVNLALTFRQLYRLDEANAELTQFLASKPAKELVEAAQNTAAEIRAQRSSAAVLELAREPPPDELDVDGTVYRLKPERLHLPAGPHTLVVRRRGFADAVTTLVMEAGTTYRVQASNRTAAEEEALRFLSQANPSAALEVCDKGLRDQDLPALHLLRARALMALFHVEAAEEEAHQLLERGRHEDDARALLMRASDLRRERGKLNVLAGIAPCELLVDGTLTSQCEVHRWVEAGPHTLALRRDGKAEERRVKVRAGAETLVDFSLPAEMDPVVARAASSAPKAQAQAPAQPTHRSPARVGAAVGGGLGAGVLLLSTVPGLASAVCLALGALVAQATLAVVLPDGRVVTGLPLTGQGFVVRAALLAAGAGGFVVLGGLGGLLVIAGAALILVSVGVGASGAALAE